MFKPLSIIPFVKNSIWNISKLIEIWENCIIYQLKNLITVYADIKLVYFCPYHYVGILFNKIVSFSPSAESLDITEHQGSHMIFTLHVYQYRIDKTGRGGGIILPLIFCLKAHCRGTDLLIRQLERTELGKLQ